MPVVLHIHAHHGRDAREGIDHHGEQRAVAEAGEIGAVDRGEQQPGFLRLQHRRLARPDDVRGPADRGRRIGGHDLADDQVVEQVPDGRAKCCLTVGALAVACSASM